MIDYLMEFSVEATFTVTATDELQALKLGNATLQLFYGELRKVASTYRMRLDVPDFVSPEEVK